MPKTKAKPKTDMYITDMRVLPTPQQDRDTVHKLREQEQQTFPRDPVRARARSGNRT